MKYKFLNHTSEAKFQAYGKNLEESFVNAGLAMTSILVDGKISNKIKKHIKLKTKNKESLLYDFLQELLYLIDTEGLLLSSISKITIKCQEECLLQATLLMDYAKNYETTGHVKAITYNEMFIKEEKNKVIVQIVVDV